MVCYKILSPFIELNHFDEKKAVMDDDDISAVIQGNTI